MANFTGTKPKDTYQRLVQIESDETNRFKRFQDGLGNPIATASFDTLEVLHDLHVRSGSVFAQSFVTTYVTSSTLFQSGSTKFGDGLEDKHEMTGSVVITGSLELEGTDFTIRGSLNHLGQYNHTGNTVQIGDVNLTGNKIHTGNLTITGLSSLVGDLEQTGNFNLTGSISTLGNISANPGVFMNPKRYNSLVEVPANHNAVMYGPISNATTIRINKNSKLRILR